MKKSVLFKLMTFLLAFVFLFSCSDNTEDGKKETVKDFEPVVYKSNGVDISEYSIVVSNNAGKPTLYAQTVLNTYIEKAIGKKLKETTDLTSESQYEIIVGDTNRKEVSSVNFNSFGEEGFLVKAVGDDLVIAGNDTRGVIYGVYAYLEALGFRFYSSDVEKIPDSDDVFVAKNIELKNNSPFIYREMTYYDSWDIETSVAMGINSSFMREELKSNPKYGGAYYYAGGGTYMVHTASKLLPSSYYSEHPDYFSMINGNRNTDQPCFTSEGALEIVYNSVITLLGKDPKAHVVNISQNDAGEENYCHCPTCMESYAKYGRSGTVLRFVNEIAKRIKEPYPNVLVEMIAYSFTTDEPKNVVAEDNVNIMVCASDMCNLHTPDDECASLKKQKNILKSWTNISKHVTVWTYTQNYMNYLSIYPNFESLYYNINYLANNGVDGLYNEGIGRVSGEFGKLRVYLLSKLMMNPNMSKEEYIYHMKDFLNGYYGDGGKYIYEYITYMNQLIKKTCAENDVDLTIMGGQDQYLPLEYDFATSSYDLSWINHCEELWESAEELATKEQKERIYQSKIHFTYTELFYTMQDRYGSGSSDEREELYNKNKELYERMMKYGVVDIQMGTQINRNITDFSISPNKWRVNS